MHKLLFILIIFWGWPNQAQTQQGLASVRPLAHEGVMTKSGERFSHDSLVASHRSLPFGSVVKVTNSNNRQSVEVKINDRGPFIKGRIIDLSERAANSIGVYKDNILRVRIDVLEIKQIFEPVTSSLTLNSEEKYIIQLASYSKKENAINYTTELTKYKLKQPIQIQAQSIDGKALFKVFIGSFKTRDDAEKYKIQLPNALQNGYVTTLKP
ncbi:septal ring lytic transglycosylase RlpA family protein [Flavobacteriaceae bacterium 14752]|uniref:septal ring lytic transglycosylase RlpA family protein n=1 Tax=Mesohalobacter salilacus TaxID=2491711 RepID=UPI000F633115|nr:SPOR domain-containing protein [Flavobacteriaceae bacterium 14752]